jgi:hypothetical protein
MKKTTNSFDNVQIAKSTANLDPYAKWYMVIKIKVQSPTEDGGLQHDSRRLTG